MGEVEPLPSPVDLFANLGLPSPEDQAREAAEAAAWRAAMLDAALTTSGHLAAILGALTGLRADLAALAKEVGDLAERVPAMPRIFRSGP